MPARTSAEVVNATLLEVFLAFVFVVLSVAWFERSRATDLEQGARKAGVLADSLAAQVQANSLLRDSIGRLNARLFESPYAPPCEPQERPRQFIEVTLARPGRLEVLARRSRFGLRSGQRLALSLGDFRSTFAELWQHSRKQGCRFIALVHDTDAISKAEFKRGLAVVQSIFYTYGELR